jgi:hypothetical protein
VVERSPVKRLVLSSSLRGGANSISTLYLVRLSMLFDNGNPVRKVEIEDSLSIFYAVLKYAEYFNIEVSKLLKIIENINRTLVSLMVNIVLSPVILISPDLINVKFFSYVINFAFSYGLTYLIEILTKRIYKPKYYDRTNMNLADVINKVSGPNQNWDILDSEEAKFRKNIEFRSSTLFSSILITFLVALITSVLINNGNPFRSAISIDLLSNSVAVIFTYLISMFFVITFSYYLKSKTLNTFIFGGLAFTTFTIFFFFLINSYVQLYFR